MACLVSGSALAGPPDGATSLAISDLPVGYAAMAFEAPVAAGGSWGSVGIGGLYGPGVNGHDASMALAFSLGNPDDYAGLDVATVLSSLSGSNGGPAGFGHDGSLAFKLHRNLGDYTSIAIGANDVVRWGSDVFFDKNPRGHYAVVTRALFVGDHVLILSGGVGHNIEDKDNAGTDIFGSAAFYFTPWLSLIAEDTYQYTNAAISIAPLPQWLPLTITAGYVDLFSQRNNHPRFSVTAGLGYHFE